MKRRRGMTQEQMSCDKEERWRSACLGGDESWNL